MIDCRFVPVAAWPKSPTPSYRRKKSPFDVKYSKLLDDLERELKHLAATNIVIQAYFDRADIRNDGWPRSSARPSGPGMIVSFTKRGGQEISFPCDTYLNYESNLRAISLTLTALRSIDRYGVTQHAEQYKGWSKLPPAPEKMTAETASSFLYLNSGIRPTDSSTFRSAYREAARKLHPDNQETGSHGQFTMLGQAKDALEQAYGW